MHTEIDTKKEKVRNTDLDIWYSFYAFIYIGLTIIFVL